MFEEIQLLVLKRSGCRCDSLFLKAGAKAGATAGFLSDPVACATAGF